MEGVTRLYDLARDPWEKHDLAAAQPELVEQLRKQLDERFASYEKLSLREPKNVMDEMDQERLKALGYLESE